MQLMRKNRRNPSGAEAAEMIEENYQNNSTCKGQASSCERSLHQSAQGPGPGPARAGGGGGGRGGCLCFANTQAQKRRKMRTSIHSSFDKPSKHLTSRKDKVMIKPRNTPFCIDNLYIHV